MSQRLDPTLAEQLRDGDTSAETKADAILAYLAERGQSNYDPHVTQLEHALQTASLAKDANAPTTLIVSALLHDIGHLLVDEHAATGDFLASDLNHEEVGAEYLQTFFDIEILEPIRLHVAAKRYLCTTDEQYYDSLSTASQQSFQLQGGKLSESEKLELERNPHLDAALQLRRWDDAAKVNGKQTPTLSAFRDALIDALAGKSSLS